MAKQSGRGGPNRGVKKDSHEKVTILSVHNTGIELADVNERIKRMNRLGRPDGMDAVWEQNRPESRGFLYGKNKNAPERGS